MVLFIDLEPGMTKLPQGGDLFKPGRAVTRNDLTPVMLSHVVIHGSPPEY